MPKSDNSKPRDRANYQKEYHAKDPEAATRRKETERDHRDRARTYWRCKILYGRTLPDLLAGISQKIIDQEEIAYRGTMAEPVEVVTSE